MKRYPIAFAALLFLAACGSDSADGKYNRAASDDLIEEQIDSATKASVDSVAKATDKGKILYPLPDTLTLLLQQKQPQATVVTLTDKAMVPENPQGENPLFLRGNFNGNNTPDYVVQVLHNDSIKVLAFLDYNKQVREVEVATYPALQLNEQWYSTYQLQLAPKDVVVMDNRLRKKVPLPTDGVSVRGYDRTTLYLLKNGRFIPFDSKE